MAETKLLQLTIARINEPVFTGEVTQVSVPGIDGDMTILANHEPLISPLRAGNVVVQLVDGTTLEYELQQGTIEIADNSATVLL